MINNTKNKGMQNKYKFVKYFNNLKIIKLNPIVYNFNIGLSSNINENNIIIVISRLGNGKTNFIIKINKNINIKNEYSN